MRKLRQKVADSSAAPPMFYVYVMGFHRIALTVSRFPQNLWKIINFARLKTCLWILRGYTHRIFFEKKLACLCTVMYWTQQRYLISRNLSLRISCIRMSLVKRCDVGIPRSFKSFAIVAENLRITSLTLLYRITWLLLSVCRVFTVSARSSFLKEMIIMSSILDWCVCLRWVGPQVVGIKGCHRRRCHFRCWHSLFSC